MTPTTMTTATQHDYHGEATILYLEGETPVGRQHVYCCGAGDGRSAYYPNRAWFCPTCGSLWARAIYDFLFSYDPIPRAAWVTQSRPCVLCGDGRLLDDLEGADHNLLTRELSAALEQYNDSR